MSFLMRITSFLTIIFRGRNRYGKYKKMYRRNLREVPSFELVSKLAQGRVLDIGCGIGYLSKLFNNYVGIDFDKRAIKIAKSNTNANFIVASATHLPIRDQAFGTAISYDSIEHVENVAQAIAEMKRVSEKSIISCVDFNSYYKLFTFDETHKNLIKPEELRFILSRFFARVQLFRTSGLFVVPDFFNSFLSKHFPNQLVFEVCETKLS